MPIFSPAIFDGAIFDTASGGGGPTALTFGALQAAPGVSVGTYTFTGMAIGAAAASRWVIAAICVVHNGSRFLSSVTIGGVAASQMYAAPTLTISGTRWEFWKANVPTGTTADVAIVANSGTFFDAGCATYYSDAEPTFFDGQLDGTFTANTLSVSANVPADGALIALAYNDNFSTVSSWSGATSDAGGFMHLASEDALAAQTGRTVSATVAFTAGTPGFYGLATLAVSFPAGTASVSGTSSVTLDGVSQSATGVVPEVGTSSVTLSGVTQSGSGRVAVLGGISVTLAGVAQAATGQVAITGTGASTLGGVTQSATGTVADPAAGILGNSTVTLGGVTQTAAGQVAVRGSSAVTLAGISQSAAGQVAVRGTSAITLGGVTQTGAGRVTAIGTSAVTLAGVTQAGTGRVAARGASSVALDGVAQTGAGQVPVRGGSAVTLDGVTLAGVGGGALPAIEGVGFAILQGIVQQASGTVATPVSPPYDWTPPVNLARSSIIGQALRFMRLSPVARHDPTSELLPALVDAFDSAIDELLSAADWSFASVLASLPRAFPALTADADLPTLCMLPGDLVQLREVRPANARWRIDGATLRISADAPVIVRYTARITREEALPATFQTAVALRIALLLGARWAGSAVEPEELDYQARQQMKQAMRDDARHAAAARAVDLPDLGYGTPDGDWAMEAVG